MARVEKYFEPDPLLLRAVAHVFKELRVNSGLTQEAFANKGNVHWRYIQEIEAGSKENPKKLKNVSIGMFYALSKATEKPPSAIMELIEKKHDALSKESN